LLVAGGCDASETRTSQHCLFRSTFGWSDCAVLAFLQQQAERSWPSIGHMYEMLRANPVEKTRTKLTAMTVKREAMN
jgi:hypothetical protein